MIPFSITEFLRVFEQYNNAVWPGQVLMYMVAVIAVGLALNGGVVASKVVSQILASLWLWMGVVYHWVFFSTINKAAHLFGALFVIQALILSLAGILTRSLRFQFRSGVQGIVGAALMTYALIVYPLIGVLVGHTYPSAPTFGVPCPTTIFTFGLLLGAAANVRFYVLVIPLLWTLLGLWAAISLGMYEDLGLVVAGLITVVSIMQRWLRRGGSTARAQHVVGVATPHGSA